MTFLKVNEVTNQYPEAISNFKDMFDDDISLEEFTFYENKLGLFVESKLGGMSDPLEESPLMWNAEDKEWQFPSFLETDN